VSSWRAVAAVSWVVVLHAGVGLCNTWTRPGTCLICRTQPGEYSTHADVNWQVLETSVFRCSCLQASVVCFIACTGLCSICRCACTGATPRHSCAQPAGHAGDDYAKTATMHNAQAFGQVCGLSERRCSCLHRVCAKLAGYTWTRPQADNHVQSPQQVCELMACSCAICRLLCFLHRLDAACTGLAQHLLLCMYRGLCNVCICIQPTTHCMVCRTHPSEVMGMWRLSKSVSSLYAGVVACRPVCCCYMHVCSVQHWVMGTPSTVPQQNERVDVVELVLSGLRSACVQLFAHI
jgi:hypothetical protein